MNKRQAIEHELEENKRQLAIHLAKPVPIDQYDLNFFISEQARLEMVIHVYQQALDEMEDEDGS